MNELLVRLERSRLVERASDPSHGRRLSYTLTAAGVSARGVMNSEVDAVQRQMVSAVTSQEADALSAYLRSCAVSLENVVIEVDA